MSSRFQTTDPSLREVAIFLIFVLMFLEVKKLLALLRRHYETNTFTNDFLPVLFSN